MNYILRTFVRFICVIYRKDVRPLMSKHFKIITKMEHAMVGSILVNARTNFFCELITFSLNSSIESLLTYSITCFILYFIPVQNIGLMDL